ncbi:hypothetical protein F4779DRAFT_627406 [Xylariaceae sp. FL0662B]|nr:hypothetical protein F4779DRAFT_627406 [Xylariaceae sp. FL0662B]
MGSYVSVPWCEAEYHVIPNCTVVGQITDVDGKNVTQPPYASIGEFQGDPDIAGIGILSVFVGVTGFAVALSFVDVAWQAYKVWRLHRTYTKEEKEKKGHVSASEILETLVLGCSDQQVVTGAAYALTLRYWRGCTISAYHYNIVANMMLLTCATHLLSVTIVRNYWKYPLLAALRVICITGVFIVTGLLMTNQNADVNIPFPTGVPSGSQSDSLLFLPAACFQSERNTATETFRESTATAKNFFIDTVYKSTPRNLIQGWNWYVIILLFYGAAIIAEVLRFFRRGSHRPGWRARVGKKFRHWIGLASPLRKVIQNLFLAYLIAGVGISCAAVILSTRYIFDLRRWVDESGWIEDDNPENDATSFGQLVPIFSSALIIFSLCQVLSEKITRHHNRKHAGDEPPEEGGTIQYLDPSNYNLMSPPPEKDSNTGYFGAAAVAGASTNAGTPPRIDLDHQSSWASTFSPSTVSVTGGGGNVGTATTTPGTTAKDATATPRPSQLSRFSTPPSAKNKAGYSAVPTQPPQAQAQAQTGSARNETRNENVSPVSSHGSAAGSPVPQSRTLTEARPGGPSRSSTQQS